jgi:hypothetical protein
VHKLSARFYLSNAIACIWLIYNGRALEAEHARLFQSQDIFYGVLLYLVLIPGVYFSYIKAKDLSHKRPHRLNVFEGIFISALFLLGVLGNSLIAYFGTAYLFGSVEAAPQWFYNGNIVFNLLAIGYYFAEGYVLISGVRKPPAAWKVKVSNYILPIYTGLAISVVWNVFMLGGNLRLDASHSNILSETIAACVLVLMIVLPFQRLFWFEIFSESQGWKANLKIVGSLLFVMLSAILPLFF